MKVNATVYMIVNMRVKELVKRINYESKCETKYDRNA
jgi:hypothetical protein